MLAGQVVSSCSNENGLRNSTQPVVSSTKRMRCADLTALAFAPTGRGNLGMTVIILRTNWFAKLGPIYSRFRPVWLG